MVLTSGSHFFQTFMFWFLLDIIHWSWSKSDHDTYLTWFLVLHCLLFPLSWSVTTFPFLQKESFWINFIQWLGDLVDIFPLMFFFSTWLVGWFVCLFGFIRFIVQETDFYLIIVIEYCSYMFRNISEKM